MSQLIHVAAAVIRNALGEVLIAKRPTEKHQGGLWEFPGGKVEVGETAVDALARELKEELGITPLQSESLIQIPYHYPDKSVLLDVFEVESFSGEPWGKEGQPIQWVKNSELDRFAFPAANKPILDACLLAKTIAVTPADTLTLQELDDFIVSSREHAVGALMLRLPNVPSDEIDSFVRYAQKTCTKNNVFLSANVTVDIGNDLSLQAVHLSARRLQSLKKRSDFTGRWLSASCHNVDEIQMAVAKGLDFITLSPVLATSSHPDVSPMGWEAFQRLVKDIPMPVYALGGMQRDTVEQARRAGAQGIAAISAWLN